MDVGVLYSSMDGCALNGDNKVDIVYKDFNIHALLNHGSGMFLSIK